MKNVFLDSNVLLYAISGRPADRPKALACREALKSRDTQFHVSVQVLNEFIANAIKSSKHGLTRGEAIQYGRVWSEEFVVHPVTAHTQNLAFSWFESRIFSLWDALVVASANLADCTELWSEDFNSGEIHGQVKILSPFD